MTETEIDLKDYTETVAAANNNNDVVRTKITSRTPSVPQDEAMFTCFGNLQLQSRETCGTWDHHHNSTLKIDEFVLVSLLLLVSFSVSNIFVLVSLSVLVILSVLVNSFVLVILLC